MVSNPNSLVELLRMQKMLVQYLYPSPSVFQNTCLDTVFNVPLNFSTDPLQIGWYGVVTNSFTEQSTNFLRNS